MPTVLIVDDEQHIRLLIEQTLEDLEDDGVELLTAADGDEAVSVVENHRPDLVFLDVMMPRRSGFEVCRVIKQELGMSDTYVVLLTAKGQAYDREQGLAAGADLYMTKPFDPDELLRRAREVLGLAAGPGAGAHGAGTA
jgi:DNA-binding response OmpR family regulator